MPLGRIRLGTIAQERAKCVKAFRAIVKVNGWSDYCSFSAVHFHHRSVENELVETVYNGLNSALSRIEEICTCKPRSERAFRLRMFRPITGKDLSHKRNCKCTAQDWLDRGFCA